MKNTSTAKAKTPTPAERKTELIKRNAIVQMLHAALTDEDMRREPLVQALVTNDLKKAVLAVEEHRGFTATSLLDAIRFLQNYMTGDEIAKITLPTRKNAGAPDDIRVAIHVRGGNVQAIMTSLPPGTMDITVVDDDNMSAEGLDGKQRDQRWDDATKGLNPSL